MWRAVAKKDEETKFRSSCFSRRRVPAEWIIPESIRVVRVGQTSGYETNRNTRRAQRRLTRRRNACNFLKSIVALYRHDIGQVFPPKSFAEQWRERRTVGFPCRASPDGGGSNGPETPSGTALSITISVADSKFTSAIVVGNVPSISIPLLLFPPCIDRDFSHAVPFAVTPLASSTPSQYLSTLNQVTTRPKMWSLESDFPCLPESTGGTADFPRRNL